MIAAILLAVEHVQRDLKLLVRDRRPELERLHHHPLVLVIHRVFRQREDGPDVIRQKLVKVLGHPHQALPGRLPHPRIPRPRTVTHHLHDIIPLLLSLEIVRRELQRIRERLGCHTPQLHALLLRIHRRHHPRQDRIHHLLVQIVLIKRRELLANVAQQLDGRLPPARSTRSIRRMRRKLSLTPAPAK